eukprot:953364_1
MQTISAMYRSYALLLFAIVQSHNWDEFKHHLVRDYSTLSGTHTDHPHKCISPTDTIPITKAADKYYKDDEITLHNLFKEYRLSYEEYYNGQFYAHEGTETRRGDLDSFYDRYDRHALSHSARMDVDDAYMNLFDRKVCIYPFLAFMKASHTNHLSNPLKRFDNDDQMNRRLSRTHNQHRTPIAMYEDDIEIEMSDMYNSLIVIFSFLFAMDYHTISLILLFSLSSPTGADVTYSGSWNTVTSASLRLPRADRQMAIGTWNDSLFILSGSGYERSLVEWDIVGNQMIDHGTTYLPIMALAPSKPAQFWSQREEILYMISNEDNSFMVFNLRDKEFILNYKNITIPIAPLCCSCLASYDDRLFVVGGKNESNNEIMNTFQIVDLATNEWIVGTSLNEVRISAGCIVHETVGRLYVIGGYTGST